MKGGAVAVNRTATSVDCHWEPIGKFVCDATEQKRDKATQCSVPVLHVVRPTQSRLLFSPRCAQ